MIYVHAFLALWAALCAGIFLQQVADCRTYGLGLPLLKPITAGLAAFAVLMMYCVIY